MYLYLCANTLSFPLFADLVFLASDFKIVGKGKLRLKRKSNVKSFVLY